MIQSNELLEQYPLIINIQTSSSIDIICTMKNSLEKSAEEMGGINVFMFLVAKVSWVSYQISCLFYNV